MPLRGDLHCTVSAARVQANHEEILQRLHVTSHLQVRFEWCRVQWLYRSQVKAPSEFLRLLKSSVAVSYSSRSGLATSRNAKVFLLHILIGNSEIVYGWLNSVSQILLLFIFFSVRFAKPINLVWWNCQVVFKFGEWASITSSLSRDVLLHFT